MIYRIAADLVVVIHFLFVLFVVFGGALVLSRPRIALIHLPIALYGALIEFGSWICPLTPLENWLRKRGGEAGYVGGFVEHYILPILYPGTLTRGVEISLGLAVLVINAFFYWRLWHRLPH
jgi:uncharacterized membrane protein YGL010W